MKYKEVTLSVNRESVDIVCAMLYDYPIQGVEIEDAFITEEEQKAMFADIVGVENYPAKEVGIRFYLSYEEDTRSVLAQIDEELKSLGAYTPLGSLIVKTEETDDSHWAHNWKTFYKPFMIGERILIRPIWEKVESLKGIKPEIIIDIDPGMAFGSGTHETTSMCVKALDKYIKGDETMIDLGCGSGILGIASAKLGIKKGILIDLDQSACKIARENVENNHTEDKLTVLHGDLLNKIDRQADIIAANIFAEVIIQVASDVKNKLTDKGLFICSGIISEKEADVVNCLEDLEFTILEIMRDGDWVAIISKKE